MPNHHVLTVTGRKTGKPRSTPVTIDGHRYRVIVRTSSANKLRLVVGGDYIRDHDSRIDSRGFAQPRIGPLRVVEDQRRHGVDDAVGSVAAVLLSFATAGG